MKRPMFVITNDYTNFLHDEFERYYYVVCYDDPFGYMWVSFNIFKDSQNLIRENPEYGTSTVFRTEEAAHEFANRIGLSGYTVREILWEV